MPAPSHPDTDRGAFRRLVNLGLLIGGFGIGQGSIFLAQTWLVATGRTQLLAQFGTHFSFAMLGIIAVEAGSLTILSAQIARLRIAEGSQSDLWRCYWETTVFRLTMALALVAAIVVAESFFELPDFTSWYLLGGLPALAIWAFNGAGFLDGLQKSGISGISGSIAYVASAVALMTAIDAEPATAGLMTGVALSLGYALTVAVQFIALSAAGFRPRLESVTAPGIRKAFIEESSMLLGLLPGQLYFRAQLAIATAFLGTTPTAMLVYAKQIVGAASQISGFARRIEFPRMVQAITAHPQTSTRALVTMQKASFGIAGLMAFGIVCASLVIVARFDGFMREAWLFLAIFSVTILTEAIGQSLVQAMFARNLFHSAAAARIIAVSIAIAVCYLIVSFAGTTAFVLADLVSHALVISLSLWWLARRVTRHGHADA